MSMNARKLYGTARDRVPNIDRSPRRQYPLTPDRDDFPDIGRDIGRVIDKLGKKVYLSLSENQMDELTRVVNNVHNADIYLSPVEMRKKYPEAWSEFIDHVHEMPWWLHQNASVSNIIKAIRGYYWQGGWLQFQPKARTESNYSLEDLGL